MISPRVASVCRPLAVTVDRRSRGSDGRSGCSTAIASIHVASRNLLAFTAVVCSLHDVATAE